MGFESTGRSYEIGVTMFARKENGKIAERWSLGDTFGMLQQFDAIDFPKGNVETVKQMYESFAEGDINAVVATWTPDIELREPEGVVGGGTFHGPDEIIETVFGSLANDWEGVSVVSEQFVDGGDTVVALLDFSGTYTETGKSVE